MASSPLCVNLVLEGSRWLQTVLGGFKRIKCDKDCTIRLKKAKEGLQRLKKAQEGSRRLKNVKGERVP